MLKKQGTDLFQARKADVGRGRSFRVSVQCLEPSLPFLWPSVAPAPHLTASIRDWARAHDLKVKKFSTFFTI